MTLLKQDPSAQRPCAKTMLGLPGMGHLQAELVARSGAGRCDRALAVAQPFVSSCAGRWRANWRRTRIRIRDVPADRGVVRRIRSILDLWWLPRSTRIVGCESPFTTDIIEACYIEIEPADSEQLRGRAFVPGTTSGRTNGVWPYFGDSFEIDRSFIYDLRDQTEHGGNVI